MSVRNAPWSPPGPGPRGPAGHVLRRPVPPWTVGQLCLHKGVAGIRSVTQPCRGGALTVGSNTTVSRDAARVCVRKVVRIGELGELSSGARDRFSSDEARGGHPEDDLQGLGFRQNIPSVPSWLLAPVSPLNSTRNENIPASRIKSTNSLPHYGEETVSVLGTVRSEHRGPRPRRVRMRRLQGPCAVVAAAAAAAVGRAERAGQAVSLGTLSGTCWACSEAAIHEAWRTSGGGQRTRRKNPRPQNPR